MTEAGVGLCTDYVSGPKTALLWTVSIGVGRVKKTNKKVKKIVVQRCRKWKKNNKKKCFSFYIEISQFQLDKLYAFRRSRRALTRWHGSWS
jgi:hypothetical protein